MLVALVAVARCGLLFVIVRCCFVFAVCWLFVPIVDVGSWCSPWLIDGCCSLMCLFACRSCVSVVDCSVLLLVVCCLLCYVVR